MLGGMHCPYRPMGTDRYADGLEENEHREPPDVFDKVDIVEPKDKWLPLQAFLSDLGRGQDIATHKAGADMGLNTYLMKHEYNVNGR